MTHETGTPATGALLAGALAGAIGTAVMSLGMAAQQRVTLPADAVTDMPPVQLMEAEARTHHLDLSEGEVVAAGFGLHLALGALFGAGFGLVQSRLRGPALLDGLVFGALVYAAGYSRWGFMPRAGAMAPPGEQSLERAALPAVAHAVYGLTTAAAFAALR